MIISVHIEKAFEKMLYTIMVKNVLHTRDKGDMLSLMKSIYKIPTANIILNGIRTNAFFLRSNRKRGMLSLTSFI